MDDRLPEGLKSEPLGGGITAYTAKRCRFTTDSVLLAAFCAPKNRERACDFGTGCGIIPLLWFRDGGPAYAAGVELLPEAAALCERAAGENGLRGRFEAIRADLRESGLPPRSFDLVSINPPYQRAGTGLCGESDAGRAARHESACTFAEIAAAAARLLRHGGRFCICHRPNRMPELLRALQDAGLEPKRLRLVQHSAGKAPFLFLLEARKGGKPGLFAEPALILYEGGALTAEARACYGNFGERERSNEP